MPLAPVSRCGTNQVRPTKRRIHRAAYARAGVAPSSSPTPTPSSSASSSLEEKLEATTPVVRAPRGALREAMRQAVRRFDETTMQELQGFEHLWHEVTGQVVTEHMLGPLALMLRVHGPNAGAVLSSRFARRGTVTNLMIDMLNVEDDAPSGFAGLRASPDPESAPLSAQWTSEDIEETLLHWLVA